MAGSIEGVSLAAYTSTGVVASGVSWAVHDSYEEAVAVANELGMVFSSRLLLGESVKYPYILEEICVKVLVVKVYVVEN